MVYRDGYNKEPPGSSRTLSLGKETTELVLKLVVLAENPSGLPFPVRLSKLDDDEVQKS